MMSMMMIFACLVSAFFSFSQIADSWATMVFLMIFFGGLLVLFVYVSTLAHNENTSPDQIRLIFMLPIFLFMYTLPLSEQPWGLSSPLATSLFSHSLFALAVGLISYLLLALLVVSHITFFHFGAFREIFVNTS